MNELSQTVRQLPDTLPDLSKFVLIGREKLNAVRAEIRAIDKVGLAKEVHEQKLKEAQEIAEAVLDAEVKIGELTKQMKKAQGFASIHPTDGENVQTKTKQLEDLGIKHHERYESLANHPAEVEDAIKSAREHGDIVTRSDVFKRITDQYDRRKREEKELREAKHRAEDYQTDDGKITDFGKVKQHKEDNSLIFQEFADEFRKMYAGILRISGNIDEDITMNAIKAADVKDLKKIADDLMYSYRCILKIQKKIAEVIDEK